MSDSILPELLSGLHDQIENALRTARSAIGHPVAKGDASETIWREMLQDYLPKRYQADTAFVVDSDGVLSDQLDVVIFDRQYSPFVFQHAGQKVIPAEGVYAVFEAKQNLNAGHIAYAQKKVASVRKLRRTSLPIPHAGGTYPAKPLQRILGGILTLESDWTPPFGEALSNSLLQGDENGKLELGCSASDGIFYREESGNFVMLKKAKAATAFLLELIARLQASATVPMIDVRAYAKWLE